VTDRPRNAQPKWRDVLTDEERAVIEEGDRAKAEWLRLNATRAGIMNRASRRARYRAAHTGDEP